MSAAHWGQRGVSLIEAVVAMGVMAFGMLAVVGLQVTMRATGDLSKQRAEAVRIAQASIEDWRAFVSLETTAGVVDYQDIVSDGPSNLVGINATYATSRTVTVWGTGSPPMKTLQVVVAWADRTGEMQTVQLSSVIAGIAPELAGSLALPPSGVPGRQPLGRNPGVPLTAKDLGSGRSGFVPPQQSGGTVAWVFNNTTGLIVGICTASGVSDSNLLTQVIIAGCATATQAQLLSGYVRFAAAGAPSASEAEAPSGVALNLDISMAPGPTSGTETLTATCFDDAAAVAAAGIPGAAVSYYCAIVSSTVGTWAGRSRVAPLGWTIADSGADNFKVCRYTTLASDSGPKNIAHPLDYTESGSAAFGSLTNQNFLVIAAAFGCPTDITSSGDFVNSNTRLHQDGVAPHDNP